MPLFSLSGAKWHHVVVTYYLVKDPTSGKSRGRLNAYLNGRAVSTAVKKGGQLSDWASMHLLFGDEFADSRDWAGQLKCVSIYFMALTPKQVAAKAKAMGMSAAPAKK